MALSKKSSLFFAKIFFLKFPVLKKMQKSQMKLTKSSIIKKAPIVRFTHLEKKEERERGRERGRERKREEERGREREREEERGREMKGEE